jgi:hypothetical protein
MTDCPECQKFRLVQVVLPYIIYLRMLSLIILRKKGGVKNAIHD